MSLRTGVTRMHLHKSTEPQFSEDPNLTAVSRSGSDVLL